MTSVWKKKLTSKVNFLLLLLFSFVCGHLINEGFRIYDKLANKTDSCLDKSIEDNCSLETKMFGLEEAEEYPETNFFRPFMIEFTLCKEAISIASNVHYVYIGLNTPPPEQQRLLA